MVQASAEKLEHTGPAKKERVALVPQRALGKYAGAAFAKRKRNRAVTPEYQIVRGKRVKVGKRHTLAWEESEWEHGEERVDSTLKEGRFQEGEGSKQGKPP